MARVRSAIKISGKVGDEVAPGYCYR